MKKRQLFFSAGRNRAIEFGSGVIAYPIIGLIVTVHPVDRTWSVHIHLVIFSIGFGWVDRDDFVNNEPAEI